MLDSELVLLKKSMENFFKEMQGKNCFTFLPNDERILCHYTKIGEEMNVSVAEEEFKGLQSIGEVFERMFKDARVITVEEYLGFPKFEEPEKLSQEQLKSEILRINALLLANKIRIAQARTYSDQAIYSFLTQDLMGQELYDLRVSDMYCTFVYELIRPDIKTDISGTVEECLCMLFLLDWRFLNFCITEDFCIDRRSFTKNRRELHQELKSEYEGWWPSTFDLRFEWAGDEQKVIEARLKIDLEFQKTEVYKSVENINIRLEKDGRRWKLSAIEGLLISDLSS